MFEAGSDYKEARPTRVQHRVQRKFSRSVHSVVDILHPRQSMSGHCLVAGSLHDIGLTLLKPAISSSPC